MHKMKRLVYTAAVLALLVCTLAVRADETSNDSEARIGIPPGTSQPAESGTSTITQGTAPAPDQTDSTQSRTDRSRIEPRERPFSLWAAFVTWLEEQIRSVTEH